MTSVDQKCIDTIRFLSVDAVQKANSGHPGMPLGAAPMAYVLWDRILKHSPENPKWFNRDRFVLSAGHGSMLIYSLLHLYGYDLTLDDLKSFRQWGSKTAGHPEYGLVAGVECTTGPLGQGFAMGVGMAMAERHLAGVFSDELVDHHTYAIVSDGDLMEGVAAEAASLAGTLKLGKIIYLYDDNKITIEGSTDLAFTEDVDKRFDSYGWHTQYIPDGNDIDAIEMAIKVAQKETDRPSLIRVRTHIGYGSPRQDSEKSHGEALGEDNVRATKEKLGWPLEPTFHVPDEVTAHCAEAKARGANAETVWNAKVDAYRNKNADAAARFDAVVKGRAPAGWESAMPAFDPADGSIATRSASGKVINAFAAAVPTMIGGSADLAGSNKSWIDGSGEFGIDGSEGRNLHYGVREHAMGAIVNGMNLHGGVVPYGATFLLFSDSTRPAMRLSALMNIPSLWVFTHDSIGVGEDGPTHQPIEQLTSLRAMPNMTVFRPADANETAACWRLALERQGPSAFALTRQNLPILEAAGVYDRVSRGGYVLSEAVGDPAVVLLATGSEVHLATAAKDRLAADGVSARVVSMPSVEVFKEQDAEYRAEVLPCEVPKLVVEAGSTWGWRDIIGDNGSVIGIDRFGESAPGDVVMDKMGFNVDNVAKHALLLSRRPAVNVDAKGHAPGQARA